MVVLLWTLIVGFNGYVFCYENLSRRPTTVLTQSSTYRTYIASKANDGKVQLILFKFSCAHTAPDRTKAWLQVDLGQSYRINNVKIYYRSEGNEPDDWKQYRFRQFYLDVSNSTSSETTTSQRTRCYTDNTTTPNLPPKIIDLPCKHTARYVIVETTYDCPEDDPITGAMLEICEIEVYGGCKTTCKGNFCDDYGNCTNGCTDGYWGPVCDSDCPANCKEPNCDSKTGQCISCRSGYWGETCNSQCPMHCFERVCDKSNGNCKKGCTPGQYGDTCNNTCSPGCVGGTCDQQSGTCNAGCTQNFTGRICDVCDATHYGPTCSLECNANCLNNACNNVNGSCKDGCTFEMLGDFCNEISDEPCFSCCNNITENYKKLNDSNSKILFILYGVIAALCTSLIVHGYMIIWISRQKKCKGQDLK